MEKLPMCRICLAENVRMHVVVNRNLRELYEKLTDIPFVTEDSRPILACFFCCAKLKQCYRLLRKCLEAEELFAQMMNEDYEPSSLINQNHLEIFSGFMKSPIEHISIVGEFNTESIAIKEELPAVCEGLDDIIEPKEEHQIEELEPDNLDKSYLDVVDIPANMSESDLEDDEPLLRFQTEMAEEQEVSKKKRRAREMKNAESLKSELPPKPLKKSSKNKELKMKAKSSKRVKSVTGQCVKGMISKRLTRSQANMHVQEIIEPELPPQRKPKKHIITEQKCFANTIAVVENSFVCPFDNSFSDYYCIYCREVFTDPNRLREHTLTHDPTTFKEHIANKKLLLVDIFKIDCRLCSITIDNIDSLKSHLTKTHGKKIYKMSNDFLKFRLTVINLTCTECGSRFRFFHALKKHMAEHFGTCICDVCDAHYFEERMLVLHKKTHQKVEESFPCKDCGKIFKSKHSRYLHEAKLHTKEPPHKCYKCDEVFFSYSLRYRHMIETHGEQRMFPCEHCERAYDSRKSLREHNRRYHLKIFKHQCDLCDKKFYVPCRLKEHMATHTGERNFRCGVCDKSYPRLRGLQVHVQSHSAQKSFRCVLCNASYTQKLNLKNHMKRQHQSLNLKKLKLIYCPKKENT